jgi:Protein of unknown function (DUF3105)
VAKKKKSRVPAPPRPAQARERRVQAPQRRVEHGGGSRSRLWFIVLGVAILLVAVGVGVAMAFRGGGNEAVADGTLGPCVMKTYPPMGRQHVNKLSAGFQYNSFPPSSGPHYPPGPKAPAVWNIYDSPVDEVALVHNLEHGGIVVQYGSKVPQAAVAQIAQWYQPSPLGLVVAPLPPLADMHAKAPADAESRIFLTAWTHVATCSGFDEDAFSKFRDAYRGPGGDAPEKFPLEALQPGGQ